MLENRICPEKNDCENALNCMHSKKHKSENGCAVHCKNGSKCIVL
jgi:hypothetical protein